jgi:hypothetical protein
VRPNKLRDRVLFPDLFNMENFVDVLINVIIRSCLCFSASPVWLLGETELHLYFVAWKPFNS